jgi:hypothetical protein
MLKIVHGDLFEATEGYLCHQTNCVTKRSAHLSKTVFTRFPYADIYTGRTGKDIAGTIVVREDPKHDGPIVVNMLGQVYPGESRFPTSKTDGVGARLGYFKSCLSYMLELDGDFAFPWRIACGAAGGDWAEYLEALVDFSRDAEGRVTVYKLDL